MSERDDDKPDIEPAGDTPALTLLNLVLPFVFIIAGAIAGAFFVPLISGVSIIASGALGGAMLGGFLGRWWWGRLSNQ